jgi:UDP-N-acetylglucosamine 2-epimerase (non-hydrolysing)
MVLPLHPRTRKMLRRHSLFGKLSKSKNVFIMSPQGYLDFLLLMKRSKLIITDSGGIQEEATAPAIYKKVLVLRRSTERPEAVRSNFAKVISLKAEDIGRQIRKEWSKELKPTIKNPYGDGSASKKIMNILNRIR